MVSEIEYKYDVITDEDKKSMNKIWKYYNTNLEVVNTTINKQKDNSSK